MPGNKAQVVTKHKNRAVKNPQKKAFKRGIFLVMEISKIKVPFITHLLPLMIYGAATSSSSYFIRIL